MKRAWLNNRRIMLIVAVLLCISSLLPARWASAISDRPRSLVQAVVVPLADPLKKLSDTVRPAGDVAHSFGEQDELEGNYQRLLAYTRQLEGELDDARAQIDQLSQIRQHLSLGSAKSVPASVASWPPGTHTLIISRGSQHSLREGLTVADGFNLVGRLSHVGALNSTVRLITTPETDLIARVMPGEPGPASREVSVQLIVEPDGRTFATRVDANAAVEVGDLAHLADDRWPVEARGMVIGRVHAIEPDPQNPLLYRKLIVKPDRSLTQISRVLVVVPRE